MPYLMAGHPKVFAQSGGHGVFSCDDNDSSRGVNCDDNDGVVYAWQGGNSTDPQANECANGKQESVHFDLLDACGYRLVSLDDWAGSSTVADPAVTQGFWVLQNHICENCTFHSFTNFRGNGEDLDGDPCGAGVSCFCADNAPNPPWQWRDHDGVGSGDWLSDPARLFDIDFEGPEFSADTFSHDYVRHPYYTHQLELVASRVNRDTDLAGFPIKSLFVQALSLPAQDNESNAITKYHWFKSDPVIGSWYPWSYGADEAVDQNVWSQPDSNRYYFTRQTQERLAGGSFQNGGRSIELSLLHELDSGAYSRVVSEEFGPGDWFSGSCSANDDSGCVGRQGAYAHCRVQVNDFTCDNGVTNAAGNLAFKLTRIRRPSAPPVARAGPDQTVECASPSGTTVMLDGSGSSDPEGDPLTYLWVAPGIQFDDPSAERPQGVFPLGSTEVTLRVSDGTQEVSDTVVVTVADTTPPSIAVQIAPAVLRPPNHRLVDVLAAVSVSDACDSSPIVPVLASITSSEPDDGLGDGNTSGDIQGATLGTPDSSYQLRAERSGKGNGRIYRAVYVVTDQQGNPNNAVGEVEVPR
jgi:hypothetical protein